MPKPTTLLWLALAATLFASPAAAAPLPRAESRYSAEFRACLKAAADAAQERRCNQGEFARQDAALEAIYRQKLAQWPDDEFQKKWVNKMREDGIRAREAVCRYESLDDESGTPPALVFDRCRLRRTAERIIMFQADAAFCR